MSTGQQTACKNFLPVLFKGYVIGSTHAPSIRLRTRSLYRTCRGCHLLRSGLAAFNDGITKDALRSERCVHDVVAHRDPTLHATASGFKARRLRATREFSKAKVVHRVADREDVRESGTMDGTSRQRRCPVCVVRTGACSTTERRSTRLVRRPASMTRRGDTQVPARR